MSTQSEVTSFQFWDDNLHLPGAISQRASSYEAMRFALENTWLPAEPSSSAFEPVSGQPTGVINE